MDGSSLTKTPESATVNERAGISKIVDGVSITLEAVMGQAEMTIAEVNALTPDAVIPLQAGFSDQVELRINGVVVGHGELVAVEDRFGVRITSLES